MTRQRTKPSPGFLDSIIIILISAALVVFLLWATSRTIGINAFEHLPDWLEQSYNAIWTSVATGVAGIGLAVVKVLTRKPGNPSPNYLQHILITTVVMLTLIFLLPRAFSRRDPLFDVTIRPHAPNQPLVTSGKIRLELGNLPYTEDINNKGEADFKGISHTFYGQSVRVLPDVDRYKKEYQTITLDRPAIDIDLTEVAPPQTLLKGRIIPPPSQKQHVAIFVGGEGGQQRLDTYGRFQFIVHKKAGDVIRVSICANGHNVYDDYQTISENEIEFRVHRAGSLCSNEH